METKWDWEMQLGHQMLGSKKLAPRNSGILVPEVNLLFFLMSWTTMFPICFVSPGFLGLHSDDGYIDVFMLFFSVSKCPLLIFQGWIPMCLYIHCPLSMSKCGSDWIFLLNANTTRTLDQETNTHTLRMCRSLSLYMRTSQNKEARWWSLSWGMIRTSRTSHLFINVHPLKK